MRQHLFSQLYALLCWACISAALPLDATHDGFIVARAPTAPGYEFLYSLNCQLGQAFNVGNGPRGSRTVIPIIGGTFEGPNVKGTVVDVGADWMWIDSKSKSHPDTRYGLQTNDGANIFVQTFGTSQSDGTIHLHGIFETGSEKYWWMNDVVAVGILRAGSSSVSIDMWYVKSPA